MTTAAAGAFACAGIMAAAPASAADMLSLGVGGYMQQWFGMSSVDNPAKPEVEGGIAQQSDTEIFFRGKLEADNGLTFSVKVELEGNSNKIDGAKDEKQSTGVIDESQVTVSGEFGSITLGAEDGVSTLTHHGNRDVGVSMYCGDVGKWINGVGGCPSKTKQGFGTGGHAIDGDDNKINYMSPRFNGVQFGVSYTPNIGQEGGAEALNNNDADAWSVGGNYKGDFGGAKVAVSLGHYSASTTTDDDHTFSNFGLQVDLPSGVGFDVAWAENDDGDMASKAGDYITASAGLNYTDGPLAVSLGHSLTDADNGTESGVTMLSLQYLLAPGVTSRTSLFAAEQGDVEGTAFVTGFVLGF